ncbi:hypothetical protein COE50_06050 [Bacillus anthracis]|nr:hypothetical protein COE50_06050 [Bacillus anthracis]
MRNIETKLSHLKPGYNYAKDGMYFILKLRKKEGTYEEVVCDCFDYNRGMKCQWLLVRQYNPKSKFSKYTNYKLVNIQDDVKVVKKAKKRKEKVYVS